MKRKTWFPVQMLQMPWRRSAGGEGGGDPRMTSAANLVAATALIYDS